MKKLLAIVLALLLLTGSLAACAASTKYAAPAQNSSSADAKAEETSYDSAGYVESPAEAASEPESFATTDYDQYSEAQNTEAGTDVTGAEPTSLADKMIYSANLTIQTTHYDASVTELEASVERFGGFVERSDTSGDVRYNDDGTTRVVNRYADYTVRVPADRFKEFLSQTGVLGNVLSRNLYAENVTSQYTDYEARLSSLNTQEERLLSMLEKSEDVESLIALEERLADVRYEIESIERSLRNLDRQIAYSTVTIYLQEVEVYTPTKPVQRTFGEKMRDALNDGWTSFVRGLQYFLIDLTYALPGLILFLVIAGAVVFVLIRLVRSRKRRKAQRKAEDAPQTPKQESPAENDK